jgi:rhomboid family GlyGly-CTERM serine protease
VPSSAEAGAATRSAGRAWIALSATLALGACFAFALGGTTAIDWQPSLAWSQPWRTWTAAWVHYSLLHLLANLVGCALVAALGIAARAPDRTAVAWLVAWPLTQLGLLLRPDLLHYGGLSGVLHAGVAAVAVHLIVSARGARRLIGIGILVGVASKIGFEAPWGEALRQLPGWDIAVAPFAHVSGFVAGVATAAFAEALKGRRLTIDRNDRSQEST